MIDLSNYKSECEPKQKIIVCEDVGKCKYVAINSDAKTVHRYTVDGNIITDGETCAFLVLDQSDSDAFFIEVKGSDIGKAIDQITRTEELLRNCIKGFEPYYRIVYRTGTHDIKSSKVVNWKKKCGKGKGREKTWIKQMYLEEKI